MGFNMFSLPKSPESKETDWPFFLFLFFSSLVLVFFLFSFWGYSGEKLRFYFHNCLSVFLASPGLELDGEDDYLTIPNSAILAETFKSTGTFSLWIKPLSDWHDGINHWLLGPAHYQEFSFYKDWNNDYLTLKIGGPGGVQLSALPAEFGGWQKGAWYHLAVSWENVSSGLNNGNVYLYVNGVLIASKTGLKINQPSLMETIYLGVYEQGAHHEYFLPAVIDEIRLWQKVLTETEIQRNMFDQIDSRSDSALVGYWRLNEGQEQIIYDATDNQNHGFLGSRPDPESADPSWTKGHLLPF